MKIIFSAVLALVLLSLSYPASSLEKGIVFGKGTTLCEDYYKKSLAKKNDFVIWAQGYLSAYNSIAPDTKNVLGEKDFYWMLGELDRFCEANPQSRFNDAVVDLLQTLHPQGIAVSTEREKGMEISVKR